MSWKDNLRDASFRGVSFFVPSHELQGGRRLVTHEYPLRDEPYTEDLGLKARRYSVEAYVIGDDYMDQRDSLVKALNEKGEGELVHPYLGSLTVQCEGYTMNENDSEGRMARFSMTFVESGENKYPEASKDRSAAAEKAADSLDDAAAEDFADTFSVDGCPEFIAADAFSLLSSFFSNIGLAISDVKDMLSQPLKLAKNVQGLISTFTNNSYSRGNSFSTVASQCAVWGSFGEYKTPLTTSRTEKAAVTNNNALVSLIRQAATAETARCAVSGDEEGDYKTRQDAEKVAGQITESLNNEMDRTMNTALYTAQTALRAAVVEALPSEELPELISVTLHHPISVLVLAYETYEDALRADDIVARNNTPHPGFVNGKINMVAD